MLGHKSFSGFEPQNTVRFLKQKGRIIVKTSNLKSMLALNTHTDGKTCSMGLGTKEAEKLRFKFHFQFPKYS